MSTIRDFLRPILPRWLFVLLKRIVRLPQSIHYFIGPVTYKQGGLLTRHNVDFMKDPDFMRAYEIGAKMGKWAEHRYQLHWRVHVLLWAARHATHLEGDFVECGVNTGGFSRAVVEYIQFQNENRHFYLMDTYNGLVEDFITDAERQRGVSTSQYEYPETYEYTKKVFQDYENVKLVRGPIPDTLPEVRSDKIAYLSIDMNNVIPEIAAAEYFWDKLVSGAIIVLDDYGFYTHFEQKKAFDKFAAERGVQVLSMPTGQGLIIKP